MSDYCVTVQYFHQSNFKFTFGNISNVIVTGVHGPRSMWVHIFEFVTSGPAGGATRTFYVSGRRTPIVKPPTRRLDNMPAVQAVLRYISCVRLSFLPRSKIRTYHQIVEFVLFSGNILEMNNTGISPIENNACSA